MGKRECGTSREAPSLSGEDSGEPAVPARRLLCGPGSHGGVLPCGPLGVQLRMRERPGRVGEGTRRRRSTRNVASWRASLIERKVQCGSGGRVASFRAPWLRRSPRDVDGASRPFSGLEKPQLDAQNGGLRRNSDGKLLLVSVLIPRNHEPCS